MITKQEFTGYLAASEQTYTFLSQMLFRELNEEAIAALKGQEGPTQTALLQLRFHRHPHAACRGVCARVPGGGRVR